MAFVVRLSHDLVHPGVDGLPDRPQRVVGSLLGRLGRADLLRGVRLRLRLPHAHVGEEEVQDGDQEAPPRDDDGVDQILLDALDVQLGYHHDALLLGVITGEGPAWGAVIPIEFGAVDFGRVSTTFHIGVELGTQDVPGDAIYELWVGVVRGRELPARVALVVDVNVGAFEYLLGAALAARRPRAVAEASADFRVPGDAGHRVWVEFGEKGRKGGVNDEGDKEEEGERTKASNESEKGGQVKPNSISESGLLFRRVFARIFGGRRLNFAGFSSIFLQAKVMS